LSQADGLFIFDAPKTKQPRVALALAVAQKGLAQHLMRPSLFLISKLKKLADANSA
jgi:hypothetical protein